MFASVSLASSSCYDSRFEDRPEKSNLDSADDFLRMATAVTAIITFESRGNSGRADAATRTIALDIFESNCPRATQNLAFVLSAHNLPTDQLDAMKQRLPPPGQLPAPLRGSKVIRVDPGVSIEFGTSASHSIYGGFYSTEQQQQQQGSSPQQGLLSATAGTLLVNNVGPNTNASHYVLLLQDAPELSKTHTILGRVRASDLADVTSWNIRVNPKTLQPAQPIVIADCSITRSAPATGASQRPKREAAAGKKGAIVREREDNEEDDDGTIGQNSTDQKNIGGSVRLAKRRRGETVMIDADGNEEVVTMAIPVASSAQDNNNNQPFDIFKAQEHAFQNNLLEIAETQKVRKHHRDNRKGKSVKFFAKQKQGRSKRR